MKARSIFLIISITMMLAALLASGQSVPQLIAYQGRLTNPAGIPLDAVSVNLTFTFYPTEFGITPFLIVAQPSVPVTKGIYNLLIGSGGILPGTETTLAGVFQNHAQVWMGVQVNSDPEMTPRARIASAAFALKAEKAEKAEKADKVDTKWLTAFMRVNDYDQDGYPKNNDCDDGDPLVGPPTIWQKFGSDIRVTNDASGSGFPSLSWTGSEFGLSWDGYFARVSAAGVKQGSDVQIGGVFPSLVWTGSEFGVSWNGINFARISATGVKQGSDVQITSSGSRPSLVWTGSEFGVSWDGIYFARISAAGVKQGDDVQITSSGIRPSLVWTGSEFGVSWEETSIPQEICFARVSSAGAKIGSDLRVTNAAALSKESSLSWTGSEFGVIWEEENGAQDYLICFSRVSSSGAKIGSELRVSNETTCGSGSPSLSWTGSEFGVSWYAFRYLNEEIYFARVSSAGAKLGSDLRVTNTGIEGNGGNGSYYPSLSWTGSEFGVSWEDGRDGNGWEIYFARIGGVCP
jgi:hypothetical protein